MKFLPTAVVALALTSIGLAFQEKAPATPAPAQDAAADAKIIAQQLPSYPLTTCPISHEAFTMGKPVDLVSDGHLVRFCCKDCVAAFKKDPATAATVIKSIEQGVIQAQKATYALKTCPISGEELGSGGMEAVDVVQGTRLVRLCCKSCVKGFQKDPAKAMAQVDAALITEQKKTYPLTTCLVGGEALGNAPVDQLYGVRLTRFCSDKCASAFAQEPTKYLAVLDKPATTKN